MISQAGIQHSLSRQESLIRNGNRWNCDSGSDWKDLEIWNLGRLIGILGKEDDNEVIKKISRDGSERQNQEGRAEEAIQSRLGLGGSQMKMLSWNIREMGNKVKRRELKGLIGKERPDFICVQETKKEMIQVCLCEFLWGSNRFDWTFKPSSGRSGGMLCIWNSTIFQKSSVCEGVGFPCVKGTWVNCDFPCAIVNIYSPCNLKEKRQLWGKLEEMMANDPTVNWCFVGDFNVVRSRAERKGIDAYFPQLEMREFYAFVDNNNLIDLPLLGRRFSWHKPNASSKSRIDRFLFTENWCSQWSNLMQLACNRTVSDHCPIILKEGFSEWGPKPFRKLDCWLEHPGFVEFVT